MSRQQDLLDGCEDAGIARATVVPPRTAPLPWRGMRDRGIPVGLGTDGIRDLWSPYGNGDMLRIALGFARPHGLRTDEELAYAVDSSSTRAAGFAHRRVHDIVAGARADIVLVDAENVQDALVHSPRRRIVVGGGRVVVRDGELQV
ncbi:amidohydrolase family protein [Streptomyces atratus]|uniref:amidohydrolase family protein n=1 Tax=Streptomyces atratus TaxID=1893 RepID=UPI0018E56450|nr:amidohydrolase family protein [Streptomyces atratus]